jgi:3-methyladenine DNA glycosylase AlkC
MGDSLENNKMGEPLKNIYNEAFFHHLSLELTKAYSAFNQKAFIETLFDKDWASKTLKQRMRHVTMCLHQCLPVDYRVSLDILKTVSAQFKGFEYMFFPDFVEQYGLLDWERSISALEHFTQFSSSEFAVRPFILQDEKRMMKQMVKWTSHSNPHVRRLATEGCRPRLPWAIDLPNFKKNPEPVIGVIEKLKEDNSEYVRRSVANNLNDISKDHPNLIIELAKQWLGNNSLTDWIIKHGCRTLLKTGNIEALILFGFQHSTEITVNNLTLNPNSIQIGNELSFSFDLKSTLSHLGKLRIEYGIYYVKANGSLSKKVFKISEGFYHETTKKITRKHAFKDLTTRKHYPGEHKLTIIINGCEMAENYLRVVLAR